MTNNAKRHQLEAELTGNFNNGFLVVMVRGGFEVIIRNPDADKKVLQWLTDKGWQAYEKNATNGDKLYAVSERQGHVHHG